jgi:hypothetical protein
MANVKYYSDLYEITDNFRRKKYLSLLLLSLQNDLNKWSSHLRDDNTIYTSPNYNNSIFLIEFRQYIKPFAFIKHISTPPILNRNSELLTDDLVKNIPEVIVQKLRDTIFTSDVYDIEKIIGNKYNRKEKLEFIEIEQIKAYVEETYQDWLRSENNITARLIAKIIYSYRKEEEVYNLWIEKFENIELIINELNKIKG